MICILQTQSFGHVVILSPNYAGSEWCLDELHLVSGRWNQQVRLLLRQCKTTERISPIHFIPYFSHSFTISSHALFSFQLFFWWVLSWGAKMARNVVSCHKKITLENFLNSSVVLTPGKIPCQKNKYRECNFLVCVLEHKREWYILQSPIKNVLGILYCSIVLVHSPY